MDDFLTGSKAEEKLKNAMSRLGIREEDIVEKFVKSAGAGGQNVNKTATCVYLKHIPTGIEVKYSKERSQGLNRFAARKLLVNKIENSISRDLLKEKQRIEKIKRQKRKRTKQAKLRILEEKRKHSQKKALRSKIRYINNNAD